MLATAAILSAIATAQAAAPVIPPGSHADPVLQRDSLLYVSMVGATQIKDCRETATVIATRFDHFGATDVVPDAADPGPQVGKRPWRETWTGSACGQKFDVAFAFIPDATGTKIVAKAASQLGIPAPTTPTSPPAAKPRPAATLSDTCMVAFPTDRNASCPAALLTARRASPTPPGAQDLAFATFLGAAVTTTGDHAFLTEPETTPAIADIKLTALVRAGLQADADAFAAKQHLEMRLFQLRHLHVGAITSSDPVNVMDPGSLYAAYLGTGDTAFAVRLVQPLTAMSPEKAGDIMRTALVASSFANSATIQPQLRTMILALCNRYSCKSDPKAANALMQDVDGFANAMKASKINPAAKNAITQTINSRPELEARLQAELSIFQNYTINRIVYDALSKDTTPEQKPLIEGFSKAFAAYEAFEPPLAVSRMMIETIKATGKPVSIPR